MYLQELKEELKKKINENIDLVVLRDGNRIELTAKLEEEPILGFSVKKHAWRLHKIDYSFGESLPKGTKAGVWRDYNKQLMAFKKMFTGELNPLKTP